MRWYGMDGSKTEGVDVSPLYGASMEGRGGGNVSAFSALQTYFVLKGMH